MPHTPGPWVLDGFNLSSVIHCTAERGSAEAKHTAGDYEVIARADGENWEDNARLIAAAPDLLSALKDAKKIITAAAVLLNKGSDYEGPALQAIRAAIAKAEGRPASSEQAA